MTRVKPDIAAERAVLAGICQHGTTGLADVSDIIDVHSFTLPSNQSIFKCLTTVLETSEVIDFPSIQSAAKGLGLDQMLEKKTEIEFIGALFKTPLKLENLRNLAIKLRKIDIAAKIQDKLQQAYEEMGDVTGNESIDNILAIAESPLFDLSTQLNSQSEERPKKLFKDGEEYLDFLATNPCDQIGISTGFPVYDKAIGGGIRRGCVHFVMARPKNGKTTLAKQFCINIAKRKVPTLMLDTEMKDTDQFHRALAGEIDLTINLIETGKFSTNASMKKRAYDWIKNHKDIPYYYKNIAGKPFEEILSIIRRWLVMEVGADETGKIKDCVVIYDYFKLMDQGDLKDMQEYQAIGFQLMSLINFCIKYDVACHAFVQSNREDMVSQSDRILWFAGSLCQLRRKTPEEYAENPLYGNTIIQPLDTRFGSLEDYDYINYNFVKDKSQLKELKTKSQYKEEAKQQSIPITNVEEKTTEDDDG